jgi:hypothetical protein
LLSVRLPAPNIRTRPPGHGHEKITNLHLYPELGCSSGVEEIDGNGEEQLAYYCNYIQERHPEWWGADAVPILWSVVENRGEHSGFGTEAAPCLANLAPSGWTNSSIV